MVQNKRLCMEPRCEQVNGTLALGDVAGKKPFAKMVRNLCHDLMARAQQKGLALDHPIRVKTLARTAKLEEVTLTD